MDAEDSGRKDPALGLYRDPPPTVEAQLFRSRKNVRPARWRASPGGPRRSRTFDTLIKSQVLYP